MRLLKLFSFCVVLFLLISCKPAGPLTPEDAFAQMRESIEEKNSKKIISLLSQESLMKIDNVVKRINEMSDEAVEVFAKKNNINSSKLKNLSIEDYITIQIFLSEKKGDSGLRKAFKSTIVKVEESETSAVIIVENGVKVYFVKESPYWKFNLQ